LSQPPGRTASFSWSNCKTSRQRMPSIFQKKKRFSFSEEEGSVIGHSHVSFPSTSLTHGPTSRIHVVAPCVVGPARLVNTVTDPSEIRFSRLGMHGTVSTGNIDIAHN
jgi:hypothetical protein